MSQVKPIPEGYHSVQPYLIFENCAEAIIFYVKALGAKERLRMARPDGRIAHAEIQIGDSVLMMADEAPEMGAYSVQHFGGCPLGLMVYTEDCDGMYAEAVAAGAEGVSGPVDQPYGDRMADIKDPFGYRWWIATHIEDVDLQQTATQG